MQGYDFFIFFYKVKKNSNNKQKKKTTFFFFFFFFLSVQLDMVINIINIAGTGINKKRDINKCIVSKLPYDTVDYLCKYDEMQILEQKQSTQMGKATHVSKIKNEGTICLCLFFFFLCFKKNSKQRFVWYGNLFGAGSTQISKKKKKSVELTELTEQLI